MLLVSPFFERPASFLLPLGPDFWHLDYGDLTWLCCTLQSLSVRVKPFLHVYHHSGLPIPFKLRCLPGMEVEGKERVRGTLGVSTRVFGIVLIFTLKGTGNTEGCGHREFWGNCLREGEVQ